MQPHQHFLIAVYWRIDVPQFQHLWSALSWTMTFIVSHTLMSSFGGCDPFWPPFKSEDRDLACNATLG
jgi:hypothetical protein